MERWHYWLRLGYVGPRSSCDDVEADGNYEEIQMKTFVLMVAKTFFVNHSKAGQLTMFKSSILNGDKIHTGRPNYARWARIAEMVNKREAMLSLRQWTGSPYNRKRDGSTQEEFLQLTRMHVQEF